MHTKYISLQKKMDRYVSDGLFPGLEWIVNDNGIIIHSSSGYAEKNSTKKLTNNPIYRIWSMTKPIVSLAIMQLIEKKYLNLHDELPKHINFFKHLKVLENLNSDISKTTNLIHSPTIFDLLNHTSGFSYHFLGDSVGMAYDNINFLKSGDTSLEEEIEKLANLPLLFKPKQKWNYSISIDILARIIEIITKQSLRDYLKENIFIPLEMDETDFCVEEKNFDRVVKSYFFDDQNNMLSDWNRNDYPNQSIANFEYPLNKPLTYQRGGHGLYSTCSDYAKFSHMLINGKSPKEQKIISEETLAQMLKKTLPDALRPLKIQHLDDTNEFNIFSPYTFGLGFRLKAEKTIENQSNLDEFGWAGAASTFFLVDTNLNMSAVLMTQVLNAHPQKDLDFINSLYL